MKFQLLLITALLVLLISESSAVKRKVKKYRRKEYKTSTEPSSDVSSSVERRGDIPIIRNQEEEALRESEEKHNALDRLREQERANEIAEENEQQQLNANNVPFVDPCLRVQCGAGRVCELDKEFSPHCVCIESCPEEVEPRRKVCSNHNETWASDCAIYQHRCWCDSGDTRCRGSEFKHVHIEYYGECREMPECSKEEMDDFPRRMRDWLFNVMRDLADRQELTPHYLKMEREAETNLTRRWINAAIWKWCDLDGHPHDRSISRHELFPIRAPLMSLEHCIAPFLNSCDKDDNHRITLSEWGKCLEIDEDEIEDRCEEIASSEEE